MPQIGKGTLKEYVAWPTVSKVAILLFKGPRILYPMSCQRCLQDGADTASQKARITQPKTHSKVQPCTYSGLGPRLSVE